MGQKVSPHGLRVGIIKDWDSKWYADKGNFADYLIEDNKVREFVKKKLYVAGVSKIVLERQADNKLKVIILTAKPEMVIGRSGNGIDELKGEMMTYTSSAEKIRNEIQALKGRRGEIQGNQVCELCDQAILSRVFYLFPCSHAFHADCLTREVEASGGFEA